MRCWGEDALIFRNTQISSSQWGNEIGGISVLQRPCDYEMITRKGMG